ncbi:HNH endonuclease [Halomarina halobia]|uniref:HNH endonuclease n=1 Tax=Halomarina halobia TaxID=3033386 RepID=A0ABD6AA39_9EURY|nr:HNH endonuclease [Halomarina sp. PSR21]
MSVEDPTVQQRIDELAENTVLSEQETRVFALEEYGFSRAEIAEELGISRSTVNEYVRRISQRRQKVQRTLDLLDDSVERQSTDAEETSLSGFDVTADGRRQLFLCPTANEQALKHFDKTLLNGVNVDEHRDLIPNQFNGTLSVWGTGTSVGKKVRRGDVLAFYVGDRTYSHIAVVKETETNKELDRALWTPYEGTLKQDAADSWPHVFYLTDPVEVNIRSPLLHDDLGYDDEFPLGFRRVANHRVGDLYSRYGSMERYIEQAMARSAAEGGATGQTTIDMHYESSIGPSENTADRIADEIENETQLTLDELRERAEDASQETATRTTTTTNRRRRSRAVKDYALARADGICEGCEENAPFVTPSGNPYLEVHHVFQVSDDGADSPDAVVAICPTCHSRIHHADDGSEYNAELIEKLRTEIEPDE